MEDDLIGIGRGKRSPGVETLWMVRLHAQVGVHQLLSFGPKRLVARLLKRDEDGVDLVEHLRVVVFEYPATLRLVVREEDSQAARLLLLAFLRAPHMVGSALRDLCVIQIVGV